MDQLVRLGAIARVEPDPADELAAWQADLDVGRIDDPAETRRRLDAEARGQQVIVRLDMFAEVLCDGRIARYDGEHVRGVWFERGARTANVAHAREMVSPHLDQFHGELTVTRGLVLDYDEFCAMPIAIEVDDGLAARLGGPQGPTR